MISIITCVMFGIDKYRAEHNYWRISEVTLLSLAALGGTIGAIVGMLVFRHKIRKPYFVLGIPVLAIIQITYCLIIK